ncbi:transcription elongation factor GreA [Oerskovia turbata]|uniref:Transcription elongation factor GreA n=2 Tax=Oerskovia TaxID=162491 RepID=A0A4Q1KW57_9CELL|nr:MULTISPECIES: transcription elongation factor GreA [Oerskovia]TGJ97794.1 transcription elongation factor GreA [Actinotalea fermentans ATCC 43279 = JCM 9966 = DSM 3133]MBD7948975.1 transcription elongation factor GreA [Oerskovia rustica]QDW64222.1 transcription elongation factor GreA [Oerskovia sp. KBS0722]RXR26785.1 transcription elongation factor GreA [Oerskovia turbata]RXR34518.1 transcription elongation factor GreA [Oerskovia turbata]
MTETSVTWLTQEAHDRLQAELAHLSGAGRTDIAERIAAARDEGDLKENGGYHAAREEQAKNEARIRELTAKLRNVQIGTPPDDGKVEPGMVVTALVAGEEMAFLLGSREIAGGTDIRVYSPTSPLGEAINGTSIGDKVSYAAPNGNQIQVEILAAKPFEA